MLSNVEVKTITRPSPTLLFEQQRRLVGKAGDDARLAGIDPDHLIKLARRPACWRGAARDARHRPVATVSNAITVAPA